MRTRAAPRPKQSFLIRGFNLDKLRRRLWEQRICRLCGEHSRTLGQATTQRRDDHDAHRQLRPRLSQSTKGTDSFCRDCSGLHPRVPICDLPGSDWKRGFGVRINFRRPIWIACRVYEARLTTRNALFTLCFECKGMS
jgi:hypothetical protein